MGESTTTAIRRAVSRSQYRACWEGEDAPPWEDFLVALCRRLVPQMPPSVAGLEIDLYPFGADRLMVNGSFTAGGKACHFEGEMVWCPRPRMYRGVVNVRTSLSPPVPKTVYEFIDAIERIDPAKEITFLRYLIYDAAVGFDEDTEGFDLAVPAIFRLFERYPHENYGVPGVLTTMLEAHGGYEEPLRASLRRQPSTPALVVAARILNSDPLPPEERRAWIRDIEEVIGHPDASDEERTLAREILEDEQRRRFRGP